MQAAINIINQLLSIFYTSPTKKSQQSIFEGDWEKCTTSIRPGIYAFLSQKHNMKYILLNTGTTFVEKNQLYSEV